MESNNDPAGGDMFLQAIDLIKTKFVYNISSQGRHKFFMVTFPYASPAHLIPGLKDKLRTFQLMQDIGSLFMAIHGLPESHSDQRTYGKDINDKDYVKCAEGLGLRNAIETVEALPKATEDTSDSDSLSSWPSECSSCSDEDIWAQDNDQFLLWWYFISPNISFIFAITCWYCCAGVILIKSLPCMTVQLLCCVTYLSRLGHWKRELMENICTIC